MFVVQRATRWEICDSPWPYKQYVVKLEFKPRTSGVCDTNSELLRLNWDIPVHCAAFPYKTMWPFPSEGQIVLGIVLSPITPYREETHTIPNHKLSLISMPTSFPLFYSHLFLISRLVSTSQMELDKSSIFLRWEEELRIKLSLIIIFFFFASGKLHLSPRVLRIELCIYLYSTKPNTVPDM